MATAVSEELTLAEEEKTELAGIKQELDEIEDIFHDLLLVDLLSTRVPPIKKVEEARNNLERMFNLVSGMERHAGTLKNLTLKIKNLSKHVMLRIKERNNRREIKLQKQMYRARITPMLRREKKFISRLNTLKAIIGALILKADEALKKGQAILFINEFNKRRDNIVDTFKQITALEYTLRTLEGGLLKQIYIIEHPE